MNFEKLKKNIVKHGEVTFQKIKEAHPNDSFYCFALYTSGGYDYLIPTSSSYEGLEQVVERYSKNKSFKDKTIDQLQKSLKWSPCDSPLHEVGHEHFSSIGNDMNVVVDESNALYDAASESDDWSISEAFYQEVESCIVDALKELDSKGVFGIGEDRENVIINLLMGDQGDEDRIRLASMLNSPEQVERYKQEIS